MRRTLDFIPSTLSAGCVTHFGLGLCSDWLRDNVCAVESTDLYINKLDAGLATLSVAKGDPFKLTSPAQDALRG